jgi:hypothetical protein
LRRHPLTVSAFFEHCLVVTYAFQREALEPLLQPGIELDTWNGMGFVAAAFVQACGLRPAILPAACGRDFFLAGYRVFVTHRAAASPTRRGLRILRSDADRRLMVWGGNLLTRYNYRLCRAAVEAGPGLLKIRVRTPDADADVDLDAFVDTAGAGIPAGSPFANAREARRFAGPLPYTFDYEPETRSIIRIKGVRREWSPLLVRVDVREMGFVRAGPLAGHEPVLASAFYVSGVRYRWERGVVESCVGGAA